MSESNNFSGNIRVVLVIPYSLVRAGLRMIVEGQPHMDVVGETGDLDEAINIIEKQVPDIILFGLNQNQGSELEIIPKLLEINHHARLILITDSNEDGFYLQAVQYGALGLVQKTQSPEVLVKAIHKVHAGEAWIDRSTVASLLTSLTQNQLLSPSTEDLENISHLSQREREIVLLIGQGLSVREIASKLFVSESTVRHYLTSIYEKVGVSGIQELLVLAFRVGITNFVN